MATFTTVMEDFKALIPQFKEESSSWFKGAKNTKGTDETVAALKKVERQAYLTGDALKNLKDVKVAELDTKIESIPANIEKIEKAQKARQSYAKRVSSFFTEAINADEKGLLQDQANNPLNKVIDWFDDQVGKFEGVKGKENMVSWAHGIREAFTILNDSFSEVDYSIVKEEKLNGAEDTVARIMNNLKELFGQLASRDIKSAEEFMSKYKKLVKEYDDLFNKDDKEQKESKFGNQHMDAMESFVKLILSPQDKQKEAKEQLVTLKQMKKDLEGINDEHLKNLGDQYSSIVDTFNKRITAGGNGKFMMNMCFWNLQN